MSLVLRKGFGPLSSGTRVAYIERTRVPIDGKVEVIDYGYRGREINVPIDYLTERRPRTSLVPRRNRRQRRATDIIVKAKREDYEQRQSSA